MLTGIGLASMNDLADVDAIVQYMVERSSRVRCATRGAPCFACANFAADSLKLQVLFQFHDATKAQISLKDFKDRICLRPVDDEMMVKTIVTKRNDPAHPH